MEKKSIKACVCRRKNTRGGKKKRKKHRKGGKITFGRTMAAGGEFTSSVGVVISWIIGILMALTGIYLILVGSFGRFDIFDAGQCSSMDRLCLSMGAG